ncbi:MAG: exodeoxyribonuclease V subunit gamma [Methylococcaceae bacterium]|nr:exodeoxyribonuclease V subunit gamma [Methylococcaceae bacterium]
MFFLHSSNKTENLLEHLLAVIQAAPLSSPFSKELFLIQSQGMERWLSQQLASHLKVWANAEFLFPSKFFSSIAERLYSRLNDAALDRNLMLWRFEKLLRHLDDPVYQPLRQYLNGENLELKRFQLAQQLAKIFDQYQIMRPDMLSRWQEGGWLYPNNPTELWQRKLWLEITATIGRKHRGSLWLDSIDTLHSHIPGHFSGQLPERISLFGVNTLPPLFLAYLHALSQHCDLHLFLLNPSQEFWADIESKRQRAKADTEEAFTGHPLLAALGQQGREFQDMLLTQTHFDLDLDSFEPTPAHKLLQQIQNDILCNQLQATPPVADQSISVHACHSRMREVEVLRNLLLYALETDPSLELRDIVVMAPDIQDYEPFITAVFADIQYAIADRSLRLSNAALDAFIRFLQISQGRFGWQSVLDLLEQPVVYPSFDLSEDDLDLLKHWIQATNVRWGKSAQHKGELGLPELNQNTWQAAIERLLMGYSVGSDDDFVEGILPFIDIEGSSAQALGGLHDFVCLLFKASEELQHPQPFKVWHQQLLAYAEQLLFVAAAQERQQLNDLLAEFAEKIALVNNEPIAVSVIISWLETRVSEQKSTTGFLRGQLTFCSMLPMRSIPFKVIALLGMNAGEFPKMDRLPSFDLLKLDFRKGDRSSRADDRYQFLEILLSTRQQLIMTYIGQSISHNQLIPPSVVVSELLEVLTEHYQLQDLITLQPLQAFSARYFAQDTPLISFSAADCATAIALNQPKTAPTFWWQGTIPEAAESVIEIADLLRFYQHPQRYFMQRQLDVRFKGITADDEEREPFSIAALDGYSIQHDWINARLQHDNLSLAKLQAQGLWLAGSCGELEFNRQQQAIDGFVALIHSKNLGTRVADLPIDIQVASIRLLGMTTQHYQHGSLLYRYAKLKGKDFMVAWLQHLIVNQVKPQVTHLLSTDVDITFLPEHCQSDHLTQWLTLYQQGLQRPDVFFVEPAFAYIQQASKLQQQNTAYKPALEYALESLMRAVEQAYEPELQRLYQHQGELSAVLGDEFERICQTLLLPIWQGVQDC